MKKRKTLTPEQIKRAVEAYRDGCTIGELATRFGMSHSTLADILRQHTTIRKQWNRSGNAA